MKKIFLLNCCAFIASFLFATTAHAQIVDCNVFLQGNHMEIGINENGAFGTSVNAPTGYNANVNDTMYNPCMGAYGVPLGLGFVADPAKDGWSVGTPAYYGDFIMPGTPNEGWGISDPSATGYAYASYYKPSGSTGFSGPLTGSNTAYISSGSLRQAVWTGMLTSDTLTLTQTITIDTANLYLLAHVVFHNLGTSVIDSFYYVRALNPHNDEVISSIPATMNKIEHQLPNVGNLVVVSAKGTMYPDMYIELGTKDPRAKSFIMKHAALPSLGVLTSLYYGDTSYVYTDGDSLLVDGGIGLIFRIAGMGPGDSVVLDYGYSFKGGILDTILKDVDTVATPLRGFSVNRKNNISVYPNPATNEIHVSGLKAGDNITVYDIVGRAVSQNKIPGNVPVKTIATGNFNPGMYIIAVRDAGGNVVTRTPFQKL